MNEPIIYLIILIAITFSAGLILFVRWKRNQPTFLGLEAVRFVCLEARRFIAEAKDEFSVLEKQLNVRLQIYQRAVEFIAVCKRTQIADRVEQKIDKGFVQAAIKTFVPRKKWKEEFNSRLRQVSREIMSAEEILTALNDKNSITISAAPFT